MKLPQYAKWKRGKIYFQRRIPKNLRSHPRFKHMSDPIERSTGTDDPKTGIRRVLELNEWFEQLISDPDDEVADPDIMDGAIKEATHIGPKSLDLADVDRPFIHSIVKKYHDDSLSLFEILRKTQRYASDEEKEAYEYFLEVEIAETLAKEKDLKARDHDAVRLTAYSLLREAEVSVPTPGSGLRQILEWREKLYEFRQFRELCDALVDVKLDLIDAYRSIINDGRNKHSPFSEFLTETPPESCKEHQLENVAREYIENDASLSKEWKSRVKRIIEACAEFELPIDIREISRKDVITMFDELAKCPANCGQRFPGHSLRQAIAANSAAKYPTLSPNSLRDAWLAPLKAVFNYAEEREICHTNPAARIRIRRSVRGARGTAFQIDELNRLFTLPIFTGCESPETPLKPGETQLDNHEFWAPLLALFTGARTTEMAQLQIKEIVRQSDQPYILIQSGDGRRLKTSNAHRIIPVHQTLVDIGFLAYVDRLEREGHKYLFPEWTKPKGKGFADAPSQRRFRRIIVPEISSRTDPKPRFHSFRNTMKSEMSRAGVHEQHQNVILGHEQTGMSRIYLSELPISTLHEPMAQVSFPGLNLDHLIGSRINP